MPVSKQTLDEIALSQKEYEMIVERLGREPTPVELGMFGALWSEHCGYKHSRALLRLFSATSPRVLVKPGEENAGAVDIGDGLAIVMKIESHNHPSAIEPFQGAATGVGGIVRDIFTMGARPIALLNSLRFGHPSHPDTKRLFGSVVAGISAYGNCLGIPNIGGEVVFEEAYAENPLVNAMCVGLLEQGRMVSSAAKGAGLSVILVGADTGRDGIHGASGLASRSFDQEKELRSAVQVGNPFLEKCLLEACLELAQTDAIIAMQDLGAAGLTSSAMESAAKGGVGLVIDTSKVPRREKGMTAYHVMLSESQERMLVVAKKGREGDVKAIFDKWDLESTVIGHTTADGLAKVYEDGVSVADVSIQTLTEAPEYRPPSRRPVWLDALQNADLSKLAPPTKSWGGVLLQLLASPNIASKEPVYRQYDHQVMDNTVIPPGADASVLRIKGTGKGIALTTDGNGRLCYLDPFNGGAMAVAEAARNLVCVGAEPIALTDGLNFGNPQKPEVYYQMENCIAGMAEACRVLGLPVISGNVSLYNETRGEPVYPTPIIGALGLLEDVTKHCTPGFKRAGDVVFLLGDPTQQPSTLAGSEYLKVLYGKVEGKPALDLALEKRLQAACLEAIRAGKLQSAHDCSHGGLLVTLAECTIAGDVGFTGSFDVTGARDAAYFGEAASRIVVSVAPEEAAWLAGLARTHDVPLERLGVVGGADMVIGQDVSVPAAELARAWRGGLEASLG